MSEQICYICHEEENNKRSNKRFHDTGCGCKGSINIHLGCLEKLMISRGSCECPVCKRDIYYVCPHSGMRIIYNNVHGNDKLVSKYTINGEGKKHGMYYEINKEDGENMTIMEYKNGLLHGEMNLYYSGGAIHLQGSWRHGNRHGPWYEFSEDPMMGYTEVIYHNNNLIEYSKYNYQQEKVDYEYYGDPHMRALAAEIDGAMMESIRAY